MRLFLLFLFLITTVLSIGLDPVLTKSVMQQRREKIFKRCMEICVEDEEVAKPNQILCSQCRLPIDPEGLFL
ncbi:hypothetical protein RB195_013751 [Necator americanus]|uniref:Uncharacterized protein n=1 Tax=Necator americanus TaxID=51031 RepID=A0ABR1DY79_NECAM